MQRCGSATRKDVPHRAARSQLYGPEVFTQIELSKTKHTQSTHLVNDASEMSYILSPKEMAYNYPMLKIIFLRFCSTVFIHRHTLYVYTSACIYGFLKERVGIGETAGLFF